jgi:shikimate dehydrogenase
LYNTDWIGFYESIKPLLKNHHKKALILGTGGASKAVMYALKKLEIQSETVSRKKNLTYDSLTKNVFGKYQLVVNCTPLGTFPKIDESPPIPYNLLNKDYLLYDLVYNPNKSRFLSFGQTQGCDIKNGLEMLYRQAEAAWIIWNS